MSVRRKRTFWLWQNKMLQKNSSAKTYEMYLRFRCSGRVRILNIVDNKAHQPTYLSLVPPISLTLTSTLILSSIFRSRFPRDHTAVYSSCATVLQRHRLSFHLHIPTSINHIRSHCVLLWIVDLLHTFEDEAFSWLLFSKTLVIHVRFSEQKLCAIQKTKTKLRGFSPRANHTDRAAAAGRRS